MLLDMLTEYLWVWFYGIACLAMVILIVCWPLFRARSAHRERAVRELGSSEAARRNTAARAQFNREWSDISAGLYRLLTPSNWPKEDEESDDCNGPP